MREGVIRKSGKPGEGRGHLRAVADPPPDAKALRELRWFFQEAESAVDTASNFAGLADGSRLDEGVERRAEALHAAEKIGGWLKALPAGDQAVLIALFRPGGVPDDLAPSLGELAALEAISRWAAEEHRAGLASGRAGTRSPLGMVAERIAVQGALVAAEARSEAEQMRTRAIRAYERERGPGPCVVPEEE